MLMMHTGSGLVVKRGAAGVHDARWPGAFGERWGS